MADTHENVRFGFGANWTRFLSVLDEARIQAAEQHLREMLQAPDLRGKRFLDIGSGSGLSSLAARRLGATVYSFDFDPQSVNCTSELRRRYFPDDPTWHVERGDAIDIDYMSRLGQFDVVYSWGVLHHSGSMWLGIELALQRLRSGTIYLALYNDQGVRSRTWWLTKYAYVHLPSWCRPPFAYSIWFSINVLKAVRLLLKLRPRAAIALFRLTQPRRGMSVKYDILDWVGGFPFEYVRYDTLVKYMEAKGLRLVRGTPNPGIGCHEFVFERGTGRD
jgi:SAM-dependent methyltransferase